MTKKHPKTHLQKESAGSTKLYYIMVYGLHQPSGHLSAFEIDGVEYYSEPENERGMHFKLGRVLSVGMEFYHIYDFGTSTELRLEVVGERMGTLKEKVRILARNDPPHVRCDCSEKASWVCPVCLMEKMDEDCYFCDECAKEHECGEEILLPVVNSPRCGVCGYEGGIHD
jgi:hypothetical protein